METASSASPDFAFFRRGARIDHVGVVVASIDRAAPLFERLLGCAASPRRPLPEHGIDICFVGPVELLEPHPSGAVARFLARSPSSLHHVAFRVGDVARELERLASAGFEAIDRLPRPGAHGTPVAFLHPKTTAGTLVELVQEDSGTGA